MRVNAFQSTRMGTGGGYVAGRWCFGSVTCMWGRGRPRAEGLVAGRPTLLLSSSRARVSCSNCTSCSLTDSSRAAALSHCSIHTTRAPEGKRGGGGVGVGVEGSEGVTHTHPCRLQEHKSGCATKTSTLRRDFICRLRERSYGFLSAATVSIDRGTAAIFSPARHVSKSPTIPINKSLHTSSQA